MEKPRGAWLLHQLLVLYQRVALYFITILLRNFKKDNRTNLFPMSFETMEKERFLSLAKLTSCEWVSQRGEINEF